MIFRRMTENLRRQNWTSVAIEVAIVIVGVFMGIQAANWNQSRQERQQTEQLLSQLETELTTFYGFLDELDEYYATTARYAAKADAAWRGDPSVTDREFVIAAYQASQVNAAGNNSAVWAQIFGAQDLRNIANVKVRSNLARVMAFDYDLVNLSSVTTRYREEVRKVIPDHIQEAIRKHCGDRRAPGSIYALELPAACPIRLPEQDVAATAAELRAKPELQGELRWHKAAVANQLLNVETLRILLRDLTAQIRQS
ncbi:hypothetical protein [Sphingomonas xanthus]|uniref:Uncharacterized protein n=1 Tax=Sphingomonas xanthus TaxID=2594473 RepID=A0A516INR0_9SPHN|nr:hypothetical protein [Sphingomonas xanthus]QDP18555.1 hypothetical protein FMM02_00410 [Sphingomonas xanthus]